jgi:hypothetical protein
MITVSHKKERENYRRVRSVECARIANTYAIVVTANRIWIKE